MLLRLLLLLPVLWGGEWVEGRGEPTREETLKLRLSFSLSSGHLVQGSSNWLELQESVTVQESLCVFVPCRYFYNWMFSRNPDLFWFRKEVNINHALPVATNKPNQNLQEGTKGRFFLPGVPEPNNCSLTIRDVNRRDSGTYFFHIESHFVKHTYEDKMLSLKVTGLLGAQGKAPGSGVPDIEK